MSNIIYLGDEVLKELHELPNTPGIYKFLNEDKEIIYIGKAKDLSRRTKSYFSNLKNKTRKGIIKNINDALYLVIADYYFLADQDDLWEEEKLEKQIKDLAN